MDWIGLALVPVVALGAGKELRARLHASPKLIRATGESCHRVFSILARCVTRELFA